jgi:glycosyltransferase involved in cell wall biosynthesis
VSGFEGFPLSILEAMRAKLPVIASNVGGVSESVMEGVTGFLVPKGEKGPLADRLRLLLGDRDLRLRLGEQGRALYERDFSFEVMFSRTFDVYRNVLKRRGSK